MSQQSFHRTIFKSTGLFGVSKVIAMLLRVIVNKVAAIFIGVAGVGTVGYIENILNLIQSIISLGVTQSSVREVAVLNESEKEQRLLQILYKWAWISGLAGLIICTVFAKQLSQAVFNTSNYWQWFLALSFYFLFSSISSIRLAVLTGKRKIKSVVVYQIVLAVFSAVITVGLYYFFYEKGIIPSFIATAFIGFLLSLYFTKNIKVLQEKIPYKVFFTELKPVIVLGLLLSINGIFGQLCYYGIRWFLNRESNEILGIYQVSNTFLVSYLGLVFVAMSKDFYPRLTNFESDKKSFNNLVNDQTETALFIIVPAVLLLYILAPILIPILYTKDFLPVLEILHIGLLSVVLKGIAWSIGYIALAKGNKQMYFKQNILGDALNILFSIILYHYLDLFGLGISITLMFLISSVYTYWGVSTTYGFKFRANTLKVIFVSLAISIMGIIGIYFKSFSVYNPILITTLLFSLLYSYVQLKKRL